MEPYRVHEAASTAELGATEGKVSRVKRRKEFFAGVQADFDTDLDTLRQAWVDWLFLSRRRKRSNNMITRLRLDFAPVLEGIYEKWANSRHIHLHNLAFPVVLVVYVVLCTYDSVKPANLVNGPLIYMILARVVVTIIMLILLAMTRWSRWAGNCNFHIFAMNFSYFIIGASVVQAQWYNNENIDGGMSLTLCSMITFILTDSSLFWQSIVGISITGMEIGYNYVRNLPEFPARFTHALVCSAIITALGGITYLYMCVRLSRRLFLDQVLAKLQTHQLERGKDRLNGLLDVILPKSIATRLKGGEQPISDRFDDATVMFVEILDFNDMVAASTTLAAVKKLNKLYSRFDAVCEESHVMRVKIIGTSYMAICGIPSIRQHHAELTCNVALTMQDVFKSFCTENKVSLRMRIGLNCGPLVAGVIGVQKFCYDVWGDTVNTAARMCSHAAAGLIQVTQVVRDKLAFAFDFAELEESFIKGKGKMVTFSLLGKKHFERRTAPVPPLDFTLLNLDLSKANADALLDGAHLGRPHLNPAAEAATTTTGAATTVVKVERDDGAITRQPSDIEMTSMLLGGTAGGSSDEARAALRPSRQRTKDKLELPGRINESASSDDESTDLSLHNAVSKTALGMSGISLPRHPSTDDVPLTGTHSDSESEVVSSRLTGMHTSQSGGLNRFRENLLRSATLDASAPDSVRGVFLTQRATARADGKGGGIDTFRMERARNLAMAFGFDGVSAQTKEEAENKQFTVTHKWRIFTYFTEPGMERMFDDRSVQEASGLTQLSYVWALLLILSGLLYDYLVFWNAAVFRQVIPEIYTTAEKQVPGLVFRVPGVTIGLIMGLRVALGVPPMLVVILLAGSRWAVRLIPYLSMFTIWWMIVVEMVDAYLTAPVGLLFIATHRIIALVGCVIMLFRGLNIKRLAITSVVGCSMIMATVFVADPVFLWTPLIGSYIAPLFIVAILLRLRGQVSQRSYFIERMKVARRSKDIAKEQDKVDQMLTNIFPRAIFERIKAGEREIVDNHKAAVVMFADVVGFTKMSMEYEPGEIVDTLNEIFSSFDGLMVKYNLEKIKTIGDCFVCSAGVSTFNTSPFTNMASCALDMIAIVEQVRTVRGQKIDMRWGIHTGDVISAVVGDKKFGYDVFGDAVQTANLMESSSVAGRVLVSEPVAVQLARSGFVLKQHKVVQTAGGSPLNTHFLLGRKRADEDQGTSKANILDSDASDNDTPAQQQHSPLAPVPRTLSNASNTSSHSGGGTSHRLGSGQTPEGLRSAASLSQLTELSERSARSETSETGLLEAISER